MVMSNEFKGATLAEAARKATADFRPDQCKHDNQRRCNDLILKIANMSSAAGDFADEAEELEREAERLSRDAKLKIAEAAFAALGGVLAALARFRKVARIVEQATRNKKLTTEQILELLAAAGVLGAAALTALSVMNFLEADKLSRRAERVSHLAKIYGNDLKRYQEEYESIGCGEDGGFTGS